MSAIRLRFLWPAALGTLALTGLCILTAQFLFRQQSTMTSVLRENVTSRRAAVDLEECLYDSEGQMLNATMAEYLVPMAAEMPDMVIGHVSTPTRWSELGAKGAGEAGTAGAPGAVMNAINDALMPFGARVTEMPFTPERLLKALGRV